ncbi:MAG: hypothetical protein BACD_00176 [Bacteroides rodentium]
MDKKYVYFINFHVGRRVFNRYFSTREDAMTFAESLREVEGVRLDGVSLLWEEMDMELKFVKPTGNRDPEPGWVFLVYTDSGIVERLPNLASEEVER